MKICVYHNLVSGGNMRSLFDTVRGMKAQGHRVEVHNLSSSEEAMLPLREVVDTLISWPFWSPRLPGPLQAIAPLVRLVQLFPLWRTNRAIARHINAGDHDLVWVANCSITQHPMLLAYLAKPHIVYTAEHFRGHYDRMIWILRTLSRARPSWIHSAYGRYLQLYTWLVSHVDAWSLRSARRILVNSCHTQENVLRFYGKRSTVLYLGVDTLKFVPQAGEKEHLILSVGAVNPMKGHDCIIRSLQLLPPDRRPRLVIVADRAEARAERARLEQLARSLQVDLQIRVGVTEQELVRLYNQAKVVACASFLEPFGLVPLEAMACGTPVVAVREGGYRETVQHEETGLLVARDEAAFGSAIGRLLDDDGLRAAMGQRAAAFVRSRFSLQGYWDNLALHLAVAPAPDGQPEARL